MRDHHLVLEVDSEAFQKQFPAKARRRMTECVWAAIDGREDLNQKFFGHCHTYHHQPIRPDELSFPDLFSPNICALDFAMRHFDGPETILDYGCGLGTCGVYLSQLSHKVLGFDNWSQIPREVAESFQAKFDSPVRFVDWREVEPTVLMHVSIWIYPESMGLIEKPSLKWVLSDQHYANSFEGNCPEGFGMFAVYPGYLTVFRRVE